MGDERRGLRSAPAPVVVDMVAVARWGLAAWAVGLVVTGVLALTRTVGPVVPGTCVTGLVIGLLILRWARRHRSPAG